MTFMLVGVELEIAAEDGAGHVGLARYRPAKTAPFCRRLVMKLRRTDCPAGTSSGSSVHAGDVISPRAAWSVQLSNTAATSMPCPAAAAQRPSRLRWTPALASRIAETLRCRGINANVAVAPDVEPPLAQQVRRKEIGRAELDGVGQRRSRAGPRRTTCRRPFGRPSPR